MNYNFLKISTLLVFTLFVSTPAFADGLANGTVNNIDNNGSFVNKANGIDFNLNGGTTNINWDKMNVAGNETLNFNFNVGNSTAFNHVNSLNGPSIIAGSINALGAGASTSNIIISNNAGVTFANGAVVNVGALTVNAEKNISMEGLTVNKGNLFLNTTNGRIDVKGVIYKNQGDLKVRANGGNVAIGGIQNAGTIDVQTDKGIYVKAEDFKVGNKVVSGITSEYVKLASTNGGKVNIEGGKIIVGKDFLVLTDGRFVEDPNNHPGEEVNTIVTKNGKYYHIGYGGRGSSDINDATIVTKNGSFKIFASGLTVNNSKLDNMIVSSNNFKLIDSVIKDTLDIALDGTHRNDTPTTIIRSTVKNMNMEFSKLAVENSKIENLKSLNIDEVKLLSSEVNFVDGSIVNNLISDNTKLSMTNTIVNKNADVSKGSLVADGLTVKGKLNIGMKAGFEDNTSASLTASAINELNMEGQRLNLTTTSVNNLTTSNVNVMAISDSISKASTIKTANINGGSLNLTKYAVDNFKGVYGGLTMNDSIAGTVEMLASGAKFNNSTIGSFIASNASIYTNNANFLNPIILKWVGDMNITNQNNFHINIADGSVINGNLYADNSVINGNNIKVANGHDVSLNNSNVRFDNSDLTGNISLNDTKLIATNTKIAKNAYLTKSSNNDITADEVNTVTAALKGTDSTLYVGDSKYSGNVEMNGNMNNKGVSIATLGDVKLNLSNVRSLAIDNSNNSIVDYKGDLKLDKIIAQGNIEITADSLVNSISQIGTIDSKVNNVKLNIANGLTNVGTAIDSNAREYNILTSGSNTYNVYNRIPAPAEPSATETVSSTLTNYVNTLNVNTEVYNMPNQPQSLAGQFSRNVRSLAVDSEASKRAVLSEIQNGFRLESSIMP